MTPRLTELITPVSRPDNKQAACCQHQQQHARRFRYGHCRIHSSREVDDRGGQVDGIRVPVTVGVSGEPGCAAASGAGVVDDHACQIKGVDIPVTVGISRQGQQVLQLHGRCRVGDVAKQPATSVTAEGAAAIGSN